MNAGVVVFPGSNCDRDGFHVLSEVLEAKTDYIWHSQEQFTKEYDLIFLPGGFSYGDYLRCGAIAKFSPVMDFVRNHAEKGKLVMGVCNGFQILLETGLLPGAMIPNKSLAFICDSVHIMPQNQDSPFYAAEKRPLEIPIAHFEGNYFADEKTISSIEENNQVLFRYSDKDGTSDCNPNGSINDIAGLTNKKGNILGMMPHPERASEISLGSEDGLVIFQSIKKWLGK